MKPPASRGVGSPTFSQRRLKFSVVALLALVPAVEARWPIVNTRIGLGLVGAALLAALLATPVAFAEEAAGADMPFFGNAIGAGLAMGLSAIGAGYALARAGAAASSAMAEKPELFARLLIYLVLGEGLAIYGLLIALLILVMNRP